MYVFDRDVRLFFWNIECKQRKLSVDEPFMHLELML